MKQWHVYRPGANIFIYLRKIKSHLCACVFSSCERGVCGGWWDAKVPCWWFTRSIKLTAGAVRRHGRLLQPTWPQSPLDTMSLFYLSTLWSPSNPSHTNTRRRMCARVHARTHTHTHTIRHRERANKVFDLHNKTSSLEEDVWLSDLICTEECEMRYLRLYW